MTRELTPSQVTRTEPRGTQDGEVPPLSAENLPDISQMPDKNDLGSIVAIGRYIAFGVVGAAIEVLSILLTWVVVFQVRKRRSAFYWTSGAAICVTAGLIVWALLVAPMNAALSGWTPETLPADWTGYRNQWETGHAIHAALFGLGFSALVIALMAEIPDKAVR